MRFLAFVSRGTTHMSTVWMLDSAYCGQGGCGTTLGGKAGPALDKSGQSGWPVPIGHRLTQPIGVAALLGPLTETRFYPF